MAIRDTISVNSIKTSVFHVGDDIFAFLKANLQKTDLEGKVLAITSKIVSLAEKRTVNKSEISKLDLVKREADIYIGPGGFGAELTVKHGILIPSSGID